MEERLLESLKKIGGTLLGRLNTLGNSIFHRLSLLINQLIVDDFLTDCPILEFNKQVNDQNNDVDSQQYENTSIHLTVEKLDVKIIKLGKYHDQVA